MNIHERDPPPETIRKKCRSRGAGSVHDPERRAVYTHVPTITTSVGNILHEFKILCLASFEYNRRLHDYAIITLI